MMNKIVIPALTILMILSVGTVAYHYLEGWEYIDSFFYSATVLSTGTSAGFIPQTDIGKLFTVIYIFGSFGTVIYELSQLQEKSPLGRTVEKGVSELKKKFNEVKTNGDESNSR